MYIYDETTEIKLNNTAVTLGKFDGMHRGHQMLISTAADEGQKTGCDTVLFSFDTTKINNSKSITTKQERIMLCEQMGVDNVVIYPVNRETMSTEAEDFIKDILVDGLGAKIVVTGKDFCFGRNRRGNVGMLKEYEREYGYSLIIVDNVMLDNTRISSSSIRECIRNGKIEKANEMLGYSFFVLGNVVKGNQLGRTIDTRTVNVIPDECKVMPANGVYKTSITIGGRKYKSITNVGKCPTVRDDGRVTIETHVFDFNDDIYDFYVKIEFEKYIRSEKKFSDLEELKRQISLDILQANL